ncbi:cation:proton antiporter [Antarcticimicrobium luteum]|uniref:Cation:proton antiporter n=1 Tax=Antarcticimicrobium luteum TaxID=2547397 RepID=A0A4R5V0R4_9RHOB|nr:cation:proton antiporter [Antarcticimicrobium luteum]TDK44986.1 cation:proton antiporter [Antarcticimicrobium luteum]
MTEPLASQVPVALITLGVLFLLGLAADSLGHRTRLPRVTLLLGCGLLAGTAGFDLMPALLTEMYPVISIIALTMVAFLLGGELSVRTMREHGKAIVLISLSIVLVTLPLVAAGLWLVGVPLAAALVMGALATATDPAATYDVIRQTGVENRFTHTLKGIVAIDDAWGLIVFSMVIVLARTFDGGELSFWALRVSVVEVVGSLLLGLAIGVPAARLTGRLSKGEPLRIEALGLVFVTAGLSIWLELSYLIAGMTAGAVIVNLARHHTRAFHEIEHLQWPFMIIFFILAGASLEADALWMIGPAGLVYAAFRIGGRILGGWIGGTLAGEPLAARRWYGPALLPQAGVAIGMALIAADLLPQHGAMIMAMAVGTTIVFELIGPLAAAVTLARVARSLPQSPPDAESGDQSPS